MIRDCIYKVDAASAVYNVLPNVMESSLSLTEVMGLTGQAFRLTLDTEQVDRSGPFMYFWEPVFREGLANIGLSCEMSGDGGITPSPFMLRGSIEHIQDIIGEGKPVIAWDLFTSEFGVVYGYDEKEQLLLAEDSRKKQAIPYERLGSGASQGLFVLSLSSAGDQPDYRMAVKKALQMAVRHAFRERTFVGYACGIAAYDAWKAALLRKNVNPIGHEYCARLAADSRRHAAHFLQQISKLEGSGSLLERLSHEAAVCYRSAADSFTALSVKQVVQFIEAAKRNEKEGLRILQQLITCL